MFTGIIESLGKVEKIEREGSNIHFTLSCDFVQDLRIDQSLAHDGCCLTVVEINNDRYKVTAVDETLKKTALSNWEINTLVNLERCVKIDGRLDGHIVQGHIDETGVISSIENKNGSYLISVDYESTDFVTVPQGSITLNGTSLTVAESRDKGFSVAIIPYTWEFTNLNTKKLGDIVNLEFDILGKYISKLIGVQNVVK